MRQVTRHEWNSNSFKLSSKESPDGYNYMTFYDGETVNPVLRPVEIIDRPPGQVFPRHQEDWKEYERKLAANEVIEIDWELWDYYLNVLPPHFMNRHVTFLPGMEGIPLRVDFGFCEGADLITCFWRESGRYFCQKTEKWHNEVPMD